MQEKGRGVRMYDRRDITLGKLRFIIGKDCYNRYLLKHRQREKEKERDVRREEVCMGERESFVKRERDQVACKNSRNY